jgi:calcineurin-like phosphoesterase family protein
MNYQLIENWNSVVQPDDTVYHLGDFAFLAPKQIRDVIECLNGTIVMVRGNHDGVATQYPGIKIVDELLIDGYPLVDDIFMSHYPEVAIEKAEKVGMCGHIHTQWRSWQLTPDKVIYNVGVDEWDYHPICLDDIIEDMKSPKHRFTGDWKDAYHARN